MEVSTGSTIPAFRRHVTIEKMTELKGGTKKGDTENREKRSKVRNEDRLRKQSKEGKIREIRR
jgi:hypothetical protein